MLSSVKFSCCEGVAFQKRQEAFNAHVMCFLSRKYSSFFRPIVLLRRTSSRSTWRAQTHIAPTN